MRFRYSKPMRTAELPPAASSIFGKDLRSLTSDQSVGSPLRAGRDRSAAALSACAASRDHPIVGLLTVEVIGLNMGAGVEPRQSTHANAGARHGASGLGQPDRMPTMLVPFNSKMEV
jgi:hypothetical protein